MSAPRLDRHTADRILAGAVLREDAPPGYSRVVTLLTAARRPPAAGELRREAEVVAAIQTVLLSARGSAPSLQWKAKAIRRTMAAKAAAAFVVVAASATGAAAAGRLPGVAQSTASVILSKVGISVPDPTRHTDDGGGTPERLRGEGGGAVTPGASQSRGPGFVSGTPAVRDTAPAPPSSAAPASVPGGPPSTVARDQSRSMPVGPPSSVPVGPPSSVAKGPPSSVPVGPPSSVPVGPPSSVPKGPPSSAPGPPPSVPGSAHSH